MAGSRLASRCALLLLAAAGMLAGAACRPVGATPDDLTSAKIRYARHRTTLVLNCALCHQSRDGGGKLNAYGEGYKRGGKLFDGFQAMDFPDTDGDGVVNIDELRADSHPADAKDVPSPSDLCDVWPEDWPLELVQATQFIKGVTRVTPTARVLSDKAAGRVEGELHRSLTPYERDCFFVLLKSKPEDSPREELAGLLYPITVKGPSGPMQVAVFMVPYRAVAGLLVTRHCEPLEPIRKPAPAVDTEPPGAGDEEQPPGEGAIQIAGNEGDESEPLGPPAFTKPEHLQGFVAWSLDNADQWPAVLRNIVEGDPEHQAAYEAIAEAVGTALWLAEETAPRVTVSGAVGVPKHE